MLFEWMVVVCLSGVVVCGYVLYWDICIFLLLMGVGFWVNVVLVSIVCVDLVCEGGGVWGIGLVGVVDVLVDVGY